MIESVYTVTTGVDDDYEVVGIFSSEEKADEFVDKVYADSDKSIPVVTTKSFVTKGYPTQ